MRIPNLFTEREVADFLRVSVDTIRRERKSKRIGCVYVGHRVFILDVQLLEYLTCQQSEPTGKGRSESTGSHNVLTARYGVALGTTQKPDRHAAHQLAQQIFGKPT